MVVLTEYFLDQESGMLVDVCTIANSKLDFESFERYMTEVDHLLADDTDKYTITFENLSAGEIKQKDLLHLKKTDENEYRKLLESLYKSFLEW